MGLVAIQRLLPNFNEIFSAISTIKSLEKKFFGYNGIYKSTNR